MSKPKPGEDPEDDEFVDRLIIAISEERWDEARKLGDQLAEVIGDLVDAPEELVERTEGDPGGSIAAQAHLSEWMYIFESRHEFERAAEIEVHLIDLFQRDLGVMYTPDQRGSAAFVEDAEAIVDQYEIRAIRFMAYMGDLERAKEAMTAAVESAGTFGIPLDEDQQQLAAELGAQ